MWIDRKIAFACDKKEGNLIFSKAQPDNVEKHFHISLIPVSKVGIHKLILLAPYMTAC